MQEFEKLGAFYLGKTFDHDTQEVTDETILYDAKDLTTHAVCVGMTGSGKTGLCLSLLEEAAIDGIPTLAIDPKGDLGNLLLTFPNLAPKDFEPWIDPGEATRKGNTVPEHAKKVSALWKNGLASWGQDGKRIKKFRDAVDLTIFTPGSNAGVPISILKSFNAPSEAVREDGDLFRDRVKASVSGLLALLGIDADPLQSREHILLSTIVQAAWTEGKDLDLASLIREIQAPPFDRIGVMDLDSFYPSKDRFALAMTLNNLLASPGFASWMEGQPLDIQQLLWTPEGKPRIAILSIAHLSESERMFVVTLILNEMLSWVRSQAGTTSLRALLYMDEVFGYFPPTKNPPSKTPMLTLLKQARAFGLGVVLATQNPVDLDYKGLSNTGTWFLGRLQTERDKMRVLDGLEGASAAAGAGFDRSKMESILSGLKSRVFLLNNVHENEPVLFHTRWVLSYLRGPLTRQHIQKLMKGKVKEAAATQAAGAPKAVKAKAKDKAAASRPVLPPEIEEKFIPRTGALRDGEEMVYRPQLMADTRLHFTKAGTDLDHWYEETLLAPIEESGASWEASTKVDATNIELEDEPEERGSFGPLPGAALKKRSYSTWEKKLKSYLYRERTKSLWKCKALKENSNPDEEQGAFRARLQLAAREARDLKVEKLRTKYEPKLARIQERIRKAENKIETQKAQYNQKKLQTAVNIGATVLGALFGRKGSSVTKASRTVRGVGSAAKERGDVGHAKEDLAAQQQALIELNAEFEKEIEKVEDIWAVDALELDEVVVRPRKSDIGIDAVQLVWTPWKRAGNTFEPLW